MNNDEELCKECLFFRYKKAGGQTIAEVGYQLVIGYFSLPGLFVLENTWNFKRKQFMRANREEILVDLLGISDIRYLNE